MTLYCLDCLFLARLRCHSTTLSAGYVDSLSLFLLPLVLFPYALVSLLLSRTFFGPTLFPFLVTISSSLYNTAHGTSQSLAYCIFTIHLLPFPLYLRAPDTCNFLLYSLLLVIFSRGFTRPLMDGMLVTLRGAFKVTLSRHLRCIYCTVFYLVMQMLTVSSFESLFTHREIHRSWICNAGRCAQVGH